MEKSFNLGLKKSIAYLHFEDGTTFKGFVNRNSSDTELINGIWGEAAFTTGMSGYQETITDPSFLGQHIIFTNAHIGNYAADERTMQSKKTFATCLIARNFSHNNFLANIDVPLFSGADTRKLVRYLTSGKSSSHKSVLTFKRETPAKAEFQNACLKTDDLTLVSQKETTVHIPGENPIVVINYGIKQAIIDQLMALQMPLVSVPHDASVETITKHKPRLIFLSNGPGDPRNFLPEIAVVRELFKTNIPVRAICLGHQLVALALEIKIIKLPFGQRGANHPVIDHTTNKILITSQNHGYAIETESFNKMRIENPLKKELFTQHTSLFDDSIEGIATTDHLVKSVQFHPEANPGPHDAHDFFTEIKTFLEDKNQYPIDTKKLFPFNKLSNRLKKETPYKRILLIGSGPIKIGQASEFDYSGTQALKSLKEEGIDVVLLNSNPATIMTDPEMCTRTYIEPITKETIKKIILKEKVDAVLSTMGGQTALNLCVELEEENFLRDNNVALLGANVDTIKKTEDRGLFAKELDKLGYQTGKRFTANSETEAIKMARELVQFPLIIRRDFALGGKGAALVWNTAELKDVFTSDIKFPVTMEKSLVGHKEIELEVMVDCERNGVIICSIENVDPCGVHTGDSITVAPALTISDRCMQQLRTMTLTIAKHMGVVAGGANVQFAINPDNEDDIVVIEMNPRVSRSSALASKATGYPIAKISALLSIGYTLKEILNDITKASPVAFEPTLDYVALKIPIFPFNKFPDSSQTLGPQMRSVGEVLALGGSFNEAFLKALRALEMGLEVPSLSQLKNAPVELTREYITDRMRTPNELSLLTVLDALRIGMTKDEIFKITKITHWFIDQMILLVEAEKTLKHNTQTGHVHKDINMEKEDFRELKKSGFSDKHLAFMMNRSQKEILEYRFKHNIFPVYKAVDTCSGEFLAETPYFYSTYAEENEAESLSLKGKSIAILGSGPNRIGQGIEFDYSCVKSCERLKEKNIQSIMINSNPETVSTDYDSSNRLYLSPLYSEDLFDILINEKPFGVIASFSGQTGIQLRENLERSFRHEFFKINFLGPTWNILELTEDRKLFSEVTRKTSLSQTQAREVSGHKELVNAMVDIGFPVIIRPSYVIGGESMYIFYGHDDLNQLPKAFKEQLQNATTVFQVENYLENAIEYDVDLVRDQFGNFCFTVCEHIEFAGVHSGDSGMITPPVVLTQKNHDELKAVSFALANHLQIVGPINFQFAIKDGKIYCIEANPRGSRTLPFLSKAYNISLPKIATDAMLGDPIEAIEEPVSGYFSVKQSTFPFDRFIQDNILLGPKMRSTGETMGIDLDKESAILKSYQGNYPRLGEKGKILMSLADQSKEMILPYLKSLHRIGFQFIATRGTCDYIKKQGIPCELVKKLDEEGLTILEALKDENMKMVFNTPQNQGQSQNDGEHIRNSAIQYAIPCFTRPENIKAVVEALIGTNDVMITPLALQEMKH
ncbi:MAG: carbamoyl-phosphate synthase large subunit [Bacteriovorax sp.]|nr:carbamoyl-phosphate synthase large subunit [Bacteriovorax sp.]